MLNSSCYDSTFYQMTISKFSYLDFIIHTNLEQKKLRKKKHVFKILDKSDLNGFSYTIHRLFKEQVVIRYTILKLNLIVFYSIIINNIFVYHMLLNFDSKIILRNLDKLLLLAHFRTCCINRVTHKLLLPDEWNGHEKAIRCEPQFRLGGHVIPVTGQLLDRKPFNILKNRRGKEQTD